jgi:hypothetical protein
MTTETNAAAARARGQALRSARTARARTIRRRLIAGSLALFVAAWLMITLVLVSGHDPALAKRSSATAVASSATPATSSSATPLSSGSSSSVSSSDGSSGSSSGGSSSSVTTSQS